jgi:predicted ATPase
MPGHILTGTPGAGKTAILRHLEADGYPVVEEAATDVIALHQALGDPEPWRAGDFADRVVALQRRRQLAAPDGAFFDRSPVCTLALTRYSGLDASAALRAEIDRLDGYAETVFFVRNQGFVEPTAARRISFEDALRFERIHEQTYRELGFHLVDVPPGPLAGRVATVLVVVGAGK